ncbi:hypothetical protein [Candidatus Galacturonibacter soehngenii]|uniref:Uncharacterized protein n=1 Tax=Candidatus Galacturonatibacter soehngenii TaxID=2307010 RepID=A0A7V7QL12_9FIRM|nr:hypothetical protein [Candidatus Galacturonibacter soehngenii]KAB1438542.1 hypothetical protein F7O84_13480 [Candidatus Galacturonibacter soehngenii]
MPMFLISIILLTAWFSFARKRASSLQAEKSETFWENESKANNTRKTSLECLDYITIPLNLRSISNDCKDSFVVEYCNKLNMLSEKKIVNLTGISNTDLKSNYGTANLSILTQYDQNFTDLAQTLNNLGKRLYELDERSLSINVLEFAVSCKSDISHTYKLLSKLYIDTNQPEKIEDLKQTASSLNSLMKQSILRYLESVK